MPRKPNITDTAAQAVVVTSADTPGLPALADAANMLAAAQESTTEERDLLNQLLGQAQMAEAFSKFAGTIQLSKLAYIREHKLYRALKGQKMPDRPAFSEALPQGETEKMPDGPAFFSGTWDEFCRLIGRSKDQVDTDIANLHNFGEEALESMSRMGIGYRELRQYRRLPADQKTALIEAAKSGDKDSFLELAEDLIAKHAKEKEKLQQRAEDAEANLEARDQRLQDKEARISHLTEELGKAKRRVKALPPADVGEEIRKEVTLMAGQAEVEILKLRGGLQALVEHTEAHGIEHSEFVAGVVCQLELVLRQLRGEFDIKDAPDGDEVPAWMKDDGLPVGQVTPS